MRLGNFLSILQFCHPIEILILLSIRKHLSFDKNNVKCDKFQIDGIYWTYWK